MMSMKPKKSSKSNQPRLDICPNCGSGNIHDANYGGFGYRGFGGYSQKCSDCGIHFNKKRRSQ